MSITFTLATYTAFALLLLGFVHETKLLAHQGADMANVHEVRSALEVYNNEHNEYPAELSDLIPQYLEVPTNADITDLRYAQTAGGAAYTLVLGN